MGRRDRAGGCDRGTRRIRGADDRGGRARTDRRRRARSRRTRWTRRFVGARAGLRPGTADELPILGLSSVVPNLMYATGHYRSGVLLAPLTAQLVADALLENRIDAELAAFSPARFGDL